MIEDTVLLVGDIYPGVHVEFELPRRDYDIILKEHTVDGFNYACGLCELPDAPYFNHQCSKCSLFKLPLQPGRNPDSRSHPPRCVQWPKLAHAHSARIYLPISQFRSGCIRTLKVFRDWLRRAERRGHKLTALRQKQK